MSSRRRITDIALEELSKRIQPILPEGSRLVKLLRHHWQVRRKDEVVCDLWPTVLKFRFPNFGPRQTQEAYYVDRFLASLKERLGAEDAAFRKKRTVPAPKQEPPPRSPGDPLYSTSGAEKTAKDEDVGTALQRSHYSNVALDLDGEELRVLVSTTSYCESLRLTREDTASFLAMATRLKEKLDQKCEAITGSGPTEELNG